MRCRSRVALVAVLAVLAVGWGTLSAAEDGPWRPLEFLLGNWTGAGAGQPGEAVAGGTTFGFDLGGKVLIRRNRAEYPPKAGEKTALLHEDLMIIYREGGSGFRAVYFDNEGHVIHYLLRLPEGKARAVFESEGGPKEPRFRLVYEKSADGSLTTEFFVAPPGGEFRSYVKGLLKRAA